MKASLKDILLMGLGAAYTACEKTDELKSELIKKGNEALYNGYVQNEELKHNIDEMTNEDINITIVNPSVESQIDNMSEEELENLRKLIDDKYGRKTNI